MGPGRFEFKEVHLLAKLTVIFTAKQESAPFDVEDFSCKKSLHS
jgi:hypothetical protein